jgi:hypothetical protein
VARIDTEREAIMKIKLWALAAALVLAGIAGAACGKKDVKKPAIPAGPDAWLHYIPADSPLVIANLKPMPPSMADWLANALAPVAELVKKGMNEAMAESGDDKARAVVAELQGKMSREGLAEIGVSLTPRFAVYGVGLALAVRLELADGQRFRGFIERLEKAAGEPLKRATFEGVEYFDLGDEEVSVVLAVPGNELILGLTHPKARDIVLPVLLGVQRPEKSVADTGVLPKIVSRYKTTGMATGYFDHHAFVRMLTGRGSALSRASIEAGGIDISSMATAVCQKEMDSLAAIAPRVVFDYTKIDLPRLESLAVLELRSDIARDLAGVQLPVHGLGDPSQRHMFAMGIGLDLDKTVSWLATKTKGVVAAPYQCPVLADLNELMTNLDQELASLKGSMPPFVAGFRGLSVVVSDLQLAGDTPTGSGYAVLGVAQPMTLIQMAGAFLPPLAQANIKAGGAPAAVSTGMPGLDPVHVTVQGSWLGAAVGKGMADRMVAALRATPPAKGPFLVFAYDYGRFIQALQSSGAMGEMGPDEKLVLDVLSRLFGYTMATLRFEAHGLVGTSMVESQQ